MSSEHPISDAYDRLARVWAESTDDNLWNELLERQMVRSLLPVDLAGLAVLDAGCAAGAHSAWLADRGCQVTAIDASETMIAAARARYGRSIRFEVADFGQPLDFPDRSFDGILSSLALHHLEDFAVPMAEFARLLRPDGWLVVSLDHPASLYSGQPRPDYFATEQITQTWTKGDVVVDVSFWRRPLSAVVNSFADNGFLIERIREAQPSAEALRRFPVEAAQVSGRPMFIAYKAVLNPRKV
jgi:SAM-dependent methyltransferase